MGLSRFLQVDLGVVRGLAYYTGFVFEAFDRKGELRAIAGGGRYNDLVAKLGGPDLPAVGFAIGDVTFALLLGSSRTDAEFRPGQRCLLCDRRTAERQRGVRRHPSSAVPRDFAWSIR